MRKRTRSRPDVETLITRFGVIVKSYRRRMAISQEELAFRAGLHRTYVADIERGRRNITLSSIVRLIEALSVPLSEFFFTLEQYFQSPIEIEPVAAPREPAAKDRASRRPAKARTARRPRAGR